MFAYCGNSPVSRIDATGCLWRTIILETSTTVCKENEYKTVYHTTIRYRKVKTATLYYGHSYDDGQDDCFYEVTFAYTVRAVGLVSFNNKQTGTDHFAEQEVLDALAGEILVTTRNQVDNALKGRTKAGIASELKLHFRWYTMEIPFFRKNAESAEIGSVSKDGSAYDSNAYLFD
jgi:hypothetical protein